MRVALTGGTGFIGSYVVEQLRADGHDVVVLARDPEKVSGFVNRPGIGFVRGSITDRSAVREIVADADACIHIARAKSNSASEAVREDTLPAIQLFEDAFAAGVDRLIYTSSIAVFDDRAEDQFTDDSAQRPINVYGATKSAAETYLVGMAVGRSTTVAVVRPGYTFGNPVITGAPTQGMPDLPQIARAAKLGEPIEVVKNAGLQFIWAGDLARVYCAALTSQSNRRYYTSLSPEFYTWEQVARWAIELTGSKSEVVIEDTGRSVRRPPWSVEGIARDFGLRFNAEAKLKDHLAWLAAQD
ncbi:MAG TPA: NAD(P)-dependent oxidoreductase [Galbitalea sp.]|nr:NAD(P)-dependent oxidoreductase [Galbitalea sp.]